MAIWDHYPREFKIVAHRAGFYDLVLNSTIAQKGYWYCENVYVILPEYRERLTIIQEKEWKGKCSAYHLETIR